MISLPIPEPVRVQSARRYAEIGSSAGIRLDTLLQDLTGGRVRRDEHWQPADRAHLDPDLDAGSITPRHADWRPAFGQWSRAQSHLHKQGVAENDVFLFFGWFREVESFEGHYRYKPTAPDLHLCYGWLQVGKILSGRDLTRPPIWLQDHPHIPPYNYSDHLYLATDRLDLPGLKEERRGGGIFGRYAPTRCLTADKLRSIWRLPIWFHPGDGGKRPLSYHGTRKEGVLQRWMLDLDQPGHTLLDSAKQGQEFVLHTADYPEAIPWLVGMFAT